MTEEEKKAAAAAGTKSGAEAGEVVTEDQLLKSIQALETPTKEKDPKKDPEVKIGGLEKTTAKAVADDGSEELKKALEVSDFLTEFAGLIGAHVDASLETLEKGVQAGAKRDLAVLGVLQSMQKSIDALAEQMKAFGAEPAGKPTTKTAGAGEKVEVLKKGAASDPKEGGEEDSLKKAALTKKHVMVGLSTLAKNAEQGSQDQQSAINATVTFETTGQISDEYLAKAIGAYKRLTGEASGAAA